MRRHYGGPVSGDMFWPRPNIVEPMIATLRQGESCAMFGLKRIGKSSILKEIEMLLKGDAGLIVVSVDVQRFAGLDEIFSALIRALPDEKFRNQILGSLIRNPVVAKILRSLLERMKSGDVSNASAQEGRAIVDYWSLLADGIERAIKDSGRRVVLMIDELPFMLENMILRGAEKAQIESLLATLRGWRHRAGVVIVVAGSIGMQWLVRDRGIQSAHLNDFVRVHVPPLSSNEARLMLEALVVGESITWWRPDCTEAVLARLAAYYPSFIQYAFGRICDHGAITESQISTVFNDEIRPGFDASFIQQFRDRIARYGTNDRRAAHAILNAVVKSYPVPVGIDLVWDVLAKHSDCDDPEGLIESLQEDGFLDIYDKQIRVTSPLIVAWAQSRVRREQLLA